MAGLAQKGGSVWSHMIISEPSKEINSPRIPNGDSDVLLGCDLVVSASKKTREILSKDTFCVVNTKKQMTGDFASKISCHLFFCIHNTKSILRKNFPSFF